MGLFKTKKRTLVVDLAAVLKAKGARGAIAPRQQLQMLRSLSRLVQREKMDVTAVLVGKPLNKAPHNKHFDGVRVRYAKSDDKLSRELDCAMKQAGPAGVLVTEDVALEKKTVRAGKDTLRVFTFRKLLDDGNEPVANQKNPPRGGNRKRRDRNPPQQNQKKEQPKPERKSQAEDAISQMIDLVE